MNNSNQKRYSFSGHETFQCRHLWLKKGYDFIVNNRSFNDESAVVSLGVGKNMVSSIRFWMKAFNLLKADNQLSDFARKMFSEDGYDPYLEDDASLWLLHYQLVKSNVASIYHIIFNDFRKEKILFDREIFLNYLKKRKEQEHELFFNENTVAEDFSVFVKMYKGNDNSIKDIEDSFSGILADIEMLNTFGSGKTEQYQIENRDRENLPVEVLLFSILDNPDYGNSISLNSLANENNSPGSIFALNRSGLVNKITDIVNQNKQITFTDHAGIKELQIKNKPDAYSVLDKYYGK